jgi:hypothetical protein
VEKRSRPSTAFLALWLFIAFVSVHDAFLMAIHRVAHRNGGIEQNPLAEQLIKLGGGRVWLLLAAKACGTVVACALMLILYARWRRAAWAVTIATAVFQGVLFVYLLLG